MITDKFISHYTPSMMTSQMLEATLVQRGRLVARLVEKVRESATSASKHHALLIGPRGIGKTHLVSVVYHRVRGDSDLSDKVCIAWLQEEEWGVASYLDLLLSLLRVLAKEYDDTEINAMLEGVYDLSKGEATSVAEKQLLDFVGSRTLLIIVENLDEVFRGLETEGQQKLRALVQNHPVLSFLATSQSLFSGISYRTSPFYGFFEVHHLEPFSFEDALELLVRLAEQEDKQDLASFLRTTRGRVRVRAVHHLASGNPRVYVIFSQFLTRPSLDELVGPVLQTLDDLTPYYQSRMSQLSPQQRKIVQSLCNQRHAVSVADIAETNFLTHQGTSSQLKKLKTLGYVRSEMIGRESYYELNEPLMRIALEIKKNRGEPIRLVVEFLRCWYTRIELKKRLDLPVALTTSFEKLCVRHALESLNEVSDDPRVHACLRDYERLYASGDYARSLRVAEELLEIRGDASDWARQAECLDMQHKHQLALAAYDRALETDSTLSWVWHQKGHCLESLARYEEALASFEKAVDLNPRDEDALLCTARVLTRVGRAEEALTRCDSYLVQRGRGSWVLFLRAAALKALERCDEALEAVDEVLQLNPRGLEAYLLKGDLLMQKSRPEEALAVYEDALSQDRTWTWAWLRRGKALEASGRRIKAMESFELGIDSEPVSAFAVHCLGDALSKLGERQSAIKAYRKAIDLDSKDTQSLIRLGMEYESLRKHELALEHFDRAIEIAPESGKAWFRRGISLASLADYEEALRSFEKAAALEPKRASVYIAQGKTLAYLGRYSEALDRIRTARQVAGDKASRAWLGDESVALMALGRWAEAGQALEAALAAALDDSKADSSFSLDLLLDYTARQRDASVSRRAVSLWLEEFREHTQMPALGQALVESILTFQVRRFGPEEQAFWLKIWSEQGASTKEMEIPLRLLNAAVRYYRVPDRRTLLELPTEERNILVPLLGMQQPDGEHESTN